MYIVECKIEIEKNSRNFEHIIMSTHLIKSPWRPILLEVDQPIFLNICLGLAIFPQKQRPGTMYLIKTKIRKAGSEGPKHMFRNSPFHSPTI